MQVAATIIVHVHIMTGELFLAQTNVNYIMNLAHPLREFFLRVNLHGISHTAGNTSSTFGGNSVNIWRMCSEHWAQG